MKVRELLTESVLDWMGRKLQVRVTKRKPTKINAPKWAKFLGRTNEGAFHWLSNDSVLDKPNSNKYFPDAKKVEFSGFVDPKSGKGYVEEIK